MHVHQKEGHLVTMATAYRLASGAGSRTQTKNLQLYDRSTSWPYPTGALSAHACTAHIPMLRC